MSIDQAIASIDGYRLDGRPLGKPVGFYSFKEVAHSQIVFNDYLIKGVMDVGDVAFMFGESCSMKSFVAMMMAFHVAMGWPWCNFKTDGKKRAVLVVLGEGQAGYQKRLKALSIRYKIDDAPVFVVPRPVDLSDGAEELQYWIEYTEKVAGMRVELVLMDTFSLMMGGGDESSNPDVTVVVNNVREALKGRSVIFIHHTGHGDKERERGAYQIRANADVRLQIIRDNDNRGKVITVKNLKQKDRADFDEVNLTYRIVEIGTDRDGDMVSSLVMEPTDMDPVKAPANRESKPLGYVQQAISLTGSNQKEVVRKQFYALYPVSASDGTEEGRKKNESSRRMAFHRGWKEYIDLATDEGNEQ